MARERATKELRQERTIIIGAGLTEQYYFSHLKKLFNVNIIVRPRFFGKENISSGAANDLYKVTNMARAMVMQLGMTDVGLTQFVPSEGTQNPFQQKLYSEHTAIEIDKKIEELIQKEYKLAKNIINKNRQELELIVETLLVLETIVKEQIDYIHEHLELPQEVIDAKNKLNEK